VSNICLPVLALFHCIFVCGLLYVHVYMYMCVCIACRFFYLRKSTCVHVSKRRCDRKSLYSCIFVRISMCMNFFARLQCTFACTHAMHACMHVFCVYAFMHAYMSVCVFGCVCVSVYMHAFIYVCILARM